MVRSLLFCINVRLLLLWYSDMPKLFLSIDSWFWFETHQQDFCSSVWHHNLLFCDWIHTFHFEFWVFVYNSVTIVRYIAHVCAINSFLIFHTHYNIKLLFWSPIPVCSHEKDGQVYTDVTWVLWMLTYKFIYKLLRMVEDGKVLTVFDISSFECDKFAFVVILIDLIIWFKDWQRRQFLLAFSMVIHIYQVFLSPLSHISANLCCKKSYRNLNLFFFSRLKWLLLKGNLTKTQILTGIVSKKVSRRWSSYLDQAILVFLTLEIGSHKLLLLHLLPLSTSFCCRLTALLSCFFVSCYMASTIQVVFTTHAFIARSV